MPDDAMPSTPELDRESLIESTLLDIESGDVDGTICGISELQRIHERDLRSRFPEDWHYISGLLVAGYQNLAAIHPDPLARFSALQQALIFAESCETFAGQTKSGLKRFTASTHIASVMADIALLRLELSEISDVAHLSFGQEADARIALNMARSAVAEADNMFHSEPAYRCWPLSILAESYLALGRYSDAEEAIGCADAILTREIKGDPSEAYRERMVGWMTDLLITQIMLDIKKGDTPLTSDRFYHASELIVLYGLDVQRVRLDRLRRYVDLSELDT